MSLALRTLLSAYARQHGGEALDTLLGAFQPLVDDLKRDIDQMPALWHVDQAPEPWVDAILQDLGNPFRFALDLQAKRRLALVLVDLYRLKGTDSAIVAAGRLFFGLEEVTILPAAAYGKPLGESAIGVDFILGTSSQRAAYSFLVRIHPELQGAQRTQFEAVVDYLKPAHTHFVALIGRHVAPPPPRWVLGESVLTEDTVLADRP